MEDYNIRRKSGYYDRQGYTLYLSKSKVYDCYEAARNGKCIAMMANSPRNLIHAGTGEGALPNAKLILRQGHQQTINYLVSLSEDIPANTEILYFYASGYRDYLPSGLLSTKR